jgi:hypothetical protein
MLVTVVLIAALGLTITGSVKQTLATKHTLTVHNESARSEHFQVFQKPLDLGLHRTSASQGTGAHSVEQEVLGAVAKSEAHASSYHSSTGPISLGQKGLTNVATGGGSIIGGGHNNIATGGGGCTISGGRNNIDTGGSCTIDGGSNNIDTGAGSTISGGSNNIDTGAGSTISGGSNNIDTGAGGSIIGGGSNNIDTGAGSTGR